jgi:coenzyme PQQ biosynthesis protein C
VAPSAREAFIAELRAQGGRYHNLHPFHVRMDAGELTPEELRRWVANRFYYQRCIPLKDAAILSNCPEVDVRRVWIQRILDHDGTAEGEGGYRVVAAPRRGARRRPRGARVRARGCSQACATRSTRM